VLQEPSAFTEAHIPTSLLPSYDPPNQAVISRPSFNSAMVEAWHCLNGAFSKIFSRTIIVHFAGILAVWQEITDAAASKTRSDLIDFFNQGFTF
jgi:hypothetical protein